MLLGWGGLLALGKESRIFTFSAIFLMVFLLSGCSVMEKAGIINRQCKAAKDTNAKFAKDIALATYDYDLIYEEEVKKHGRNMGNCFANPDSYIRTYGLYSGLISKNTKWTAEDCAVNFISPSKLKTPPLVAAAYKNYYQVMINNQTCFKPELVIEAQRYLGLVP